MTSTRYLSTSTTLIPVRAAAKKSAAVGPSDEAAALTQMSSLEQELFDDDGHVRPGLSRPAVADKVAGINSLRRRLGWLEIDQHGRWRWPA